MCRILKCTTPLVVILLLGSAVAVRATVSIQPAPVFVQNEHPSLFVDDIVQIDRSGNLFFTSYGESWWTEFQSDQSDFVAGRDLEPGFPVQCTHTGGTYHGGPAIHTLVGNIDADPELEIIVSALATGPLYAWNYDGSLVTGWPVSGVGGAGYPGLGNLDGIRSDLEVFAGYWGTPGPLYAYDGSGTTLTGWPLSSSNYVTTPPALADVDGDGLEELFIGEEDWEIHAYRSDGTVLPGWPVDPGSGGQEIHTPAIGDLDGDGDLEILAFSGWTTPGVYLSAYHHDGTSVSNFPVLFTNGYIDTFIALGDVDGDYEPEIVFVLKESGSPWRPIVTVLSTTGTIENSWFCAGTVSYGTAPALADLTGDTVPEIIVQTNDSLEAWTGDGTPLTGWPVTWTGRWLGNSSPVVGDVDGDGSPDIVVTTQIAGSSVNGEARVYDSGGNLLTDFPMSLNIGSGAVPAIADLDLDGRNEIIITGSYWNGISGSYDKVWVLDLGGANHGPIQWGQFAGNPYHTGTFFSLVTLYLEDDTLSWTDAGAASGYDVVRGDLGTLLSTAGDFSVATAECLASKIPDKNLTYSGTPPVGQAYWFVVRPATPTGKGTYNSGAPTQVASRDAGINSSAFSCP